MSNFARTQARSFARSLAMEAAQEGAALVAKARTSWLKARASGAALLVACALRRKRCVRVLTNGYATQFYALRRTRRCTRFCSTGGSLG